MTNVLPLMLDQMSGFGVETTEDLNTVWDLPRQRQSLVHSRP